jgi:DHA1 family bicyclomycin/chloramphenicol resistance-like MFS transporter
MGWIIAVFTAASALMALTVQVKNNYPLPEGFYEFHS